jgi:hypothetical protein
MPGEEGGHGICRVNPVVAEAVSDARAAGPGHRVSSTPGVTVFTAELPLT